MAVSDCGDGGSDGDFVDSSDEGGLKASGKVFVWMCKKMAMAQCIDLFLGDRISGARA